MIDAKRHCCLAESLNYFTQQIVFLKLRKRKCQRQYIYDSKKNDRIRLINCGRSLLPPAPAPAPAPAAVILYTKPDINREDHIGVFLFRG